MSNRAEKINAITALLQGKKRIADLGPRKYYFWVCDNGVCVSVRNWEGRRITLTESELKAFEAKQSKTNNITGMIIR